MQKLFFVALAMTVLSTSARATLFDDLKSSFDKSSAPQSKDLQGHWAGRCVESIQPDMVQPAVFIYKVIEDQHEFPPYRPTFTYFWKASQNKALFDKATPQQVENDVDVKAWLAKEQWQTASLKDGSLENLYSPSEKISFRRSVRVYSDEFNSTVIVRVIKTTDGVSNLNTFCYYRQKLGGGSVDPQGEYLIQNTGWVKNNYGSIANPYPEANLRSVNILNTGTFSVNISNVRFFYKGAIVGQTQFPANLLPGQLLVVTGPAQLGPTFKMDHADFYIHGSTQNLRITGVTSPVKPPTNDHTVVELE